jgi:hypothetical protein
MNKNNHNSRSFTWRNLERDTGEREESYIFAFREGGDADVSYGRIDAFHLHVFFALLKGHEKFNPEKIISALFSDELSVLVCSLFSDTMIVQRFKLQRCLSEE